MNEETKLILENQKLLLRCFLYNEDVVIKDEIQQQLSEINKVLYPIIPPSLPEKTKDALGNK